MLKALFFLRYLHFCLEFLVMRKNDLIKKSKVNFKICDITDWATNNYNTYIAQCLKEKRLSGNGIWSVNRVKREEHFSSKIMRK